ncbi:hypothetical protein HYH02_005680 [Chlamydomonas schloesseri]|uniref:Cyclin N-terminal domain-containing protein n=1 Tax=Chlamydomonas schloesseri TaxID=2026947 RepID=A0A835WLN9_9CHLO|nr:hypothetical protein HYH02_005680 [Chlamydomonas schloesseri]|eukprot:KAG2449538.1 hypothetical protein HYH02_005680 [Chlamydomonas schloesseri]
MNYINRFFLTRSIAKNDRHCVVGGAILLASKVQESPRSVQDVAYVLLHAKNANKQQKQKQAPDQTTLEQFKDAVVLAEQAMLFAVNFNLNVDTHVSLARSLLQPLDLLMVKNPAPEQAESNQLRIQLYSALMIFLNDSAMTNLTLQYPSSQIAPVALILAAKRIAATPRFAGKPLPTDLQKVLALASDREWLEKKGLTVEQAADIESQINELYATAPAPASAQQQQQAAAAAEKQQQQAQQAAPCPPEEGEVVATGGSGRAEACPCSPDANGGVSVAGGSQCRPGQPSSSVAAGPTGGMVTAGNTPEQPQRESVLAPNCHTRKRVSECEDTDQQATSELHAAPVEQDQLQAAPEEGEGQATCGAGERQAHAAAAAAAAMEDSANENCGSPNGLTAGNASGSGCCTAEGQPEVCSHQEAAAGAAVSSQRVAKRGRELEEGCCGGEAGAVQAGKVARLEADIAA